MNGRFKGAMSAGTGAFFGVIFGVSVLPVGAVGIVAAALVGAAIGYLVMYVLPNW